MGKWMRRGLIALFVLALLGGGAYYWLFISNGGPGKAYFHIDMAIVRADAGAYQGAMATEIRVETIASRKLPLVAFVAGEGWTQVEIPVFSYQLVFPDRTIVVDTGFDAATAKALAFEKFDEAAHARVSAGMKAASAIVMTHEHMDHIGGLLTDPNLPALLKTALVTKEQFDNPERSKPIVWPAGSRDGYKPLENGYVKVIAPGVALIKAEGHTPGSQMIYVRRADGAEFLFMGDIASRMKNLELLKGRSRLVSDFIVNEDRGKVLAELRELAALKAREPNIHFVPGHDDEAIAQMTGQGVLIAGFK